jgi:hypothetical protein
MTNLGIAPVLDALDLRMSLKTLNGLRTDNKTIYRQPPSPEVDAAWNDISMLGFEGIIASAEDIVKSGKDPAFAIQAPQSWKEGSDAYLVEMDVFHQIHCLNMLRKHIHYGYYFKGPITSAREHHRDHCLYTLLQNLMCKADVGIITLNWMYMEKHGRFMPAEDFSLAKKCVDFDAILTWAKDNAIQDWNPRWKALRHPPGTKTVPVNTY